MRRYFSSPAVLLLLVLFSCRSVKAPEPVYNASTKAFRPELSTLSLPVEIPIKFIEDQINAQTGSVVYEDRSYTSPTADNLQMIVMRRKAITASISGADLLITIPLNIWAQARYETCSFCPTIEKDTRFDLDVYLRALPEVRKDYSFAMGLRSGGFEWKSKPAVSIGPFNVPIGSLIEGVIEKQLAVVSADIDRKINSGIDLRQEVERLWNMAQEPVLLDDSTQTWMQLEPLALTMAPVSGNKDQIRLQFGAETYLDCTIGSRPDSKVKRALPELRQVNKMPSGFVVQVHAMLGFNEASELASKQLVGQEFRYGKKAIRVEGIRIYGKGERAFIHLVFSGSLKGELYLSGKPKYTPATDMLSFEALDYDIQSKNLLVRTGDWLLRSTFRTMLEEKLQFSYAKEMQALRKSLSEKLKNTQIKDMVRLQGQLQQFEVQDIYVGDNRFDIALNLKGNATVSLNSVKL